MKTLIILLSLIQVKAWAVANPDFLSCVKALNERGSTKGIFVPLNDSGSDFVLKNVVNGVTTYEVVTANANYVAYTNEVKCTPHAGNNNLYVIQGIYRNIMDDDSSKFSADEKKSIAKACSSIVMANSTNNNVNSGTGSR